VRLDEINGETDAYLNMNSIKALTYVVVALIILMLCAAKVKAYSIIGTVTNYDTVTISATLTTNGIAKVRGGYGTKIAVRRFITKDLLNLLTNSDFADETFPVGAKLVLGWDQEWNGHVLVADKTGTNVIYDATYNNGNTNITVAIDLYSQIGAEDLTWINGNFTVTWYNNGSLKIIDQPDGGYDVYIVGTGPCTDHLQRKVLSTDALEWSDSQTFMVYGAGESDGGSQPPVIGTLAGSIKVEGRGTGTAYYLAEHASPAS
jgi:hypothetical protein